MNKRTLSLLLTVLLVLALFPVTVFATGEGTPTLLDISLGSITISTTGANGGGVIEATLNPAGYVIQQSVPTATVNKITVTASTSITLSGVNISTSGCAFSISGAAVSLTLTGTNTLISGSRSNMAGLQVPVGASLSIDGAGLLDVTGGGDAAGIGGGAGFGTISIRGGTIYANSTYFRNGSGAGIGSGAFGVGGTLLITGGTIIAQGGREGSGIGGGARSSGCSVTIAGGDVSATGGLYGAGIGAGYGAGSSTVKIISGKVNTTGGDYGAGIGCGFASTNGGTIAISGGEITAIGKAGGAGIGSGNQSYSSVIEITGGKVNATSDSGAGIGGGYGNNIVGFGESGTIVISGGEVEATSSTGGAGIGKGGMVVSNNGSVSISGGTITAAGGDSVADIGAPITITGGSVMASSFESQPTDGASTPNNVYLATLENLPASAAIPSLTITKAGVPFTYGLPEIVHSDGKLYLYLPANAGGESYCIEVSAGGTRKIGAVVESDRSAFIEPYSADFDKYSPEDIPAPLTLNGNTLLTITNGSSTLLPDTDYTASDSTMTIKQNYLRKLPLGENAITFNLGSGAALNMLVTVTDSTPSTSSTHNPTRILLSAAFDLGTQQDVLITLNGNRNARLTVQNGANTLVKGTDYTLSGNTILLKKEYLAQLPIGDTMMTFIFGNGVSQTLIVTVVDTESIAIPKTDDRVLPVLPYVISAAVLGAVMLFRSKTRMK
jgi:hypothetical protein